MDDSGTGFSASIQEVVPTMVLRATRHLHARLGVQAKEQAACETRKGVHSRFP